MYKQGDRTLSSRRPYSFNKKDIGKIQEYLLLLAQIKERLKRQKSNDKSNT